MRILYRCLFAEINSTFSFVFPLGRLGTFLGFHSPAPAACSSFPIAWSYIRCQPLDYLNLWTLLHRTYHILLAIDTRFVLWYQGLMILWWLSFAFFNDLLDCLLFVFFAKCSSPHSFHLRFDCIIIFSSVSTFGGKCKNLFNPNWTTL